jgi:hypothetical protein
MKLMPDLCVHLAARSATNYTVLQWLFLVILHCNSAAEKVLALYNTGLLQRAEVESYHSALVAIEAQKAAAVLAAQQKDVGSAVETAVGLSGASQVCANCLHECWGNHCCRHCAITVTFFPES